MQIALSAKNKLVIVIGDFAPATETSHLYVLRLVCFLTDDKISLIIVIIKSKYNHM